MPLYKGPTISRKPGTRSGQSAESSDGGMASGEDSHGSSTSDSESEGGGSGADSSGQSYRERPSGTVSRRRDWGDPNEYHDTTPRAVAAQFRKVVGERRSWKKLAKTYQERMKEAGQQSGSESDASTSSFKPRRGRGRPASPGTSSSCLSEHARRFWSQLQPRTSKQRVFILNYLTEQLDVDERKALWATPTGTQAAFVAQRQAVYDQRTLFFNPVRTAEAQLEATVSSRTLRTMNELITKDVDPTTGKAVACVVVPYPEMAADGSNICRKANRALGIRHSIKMGPIFATPKKVAATIDSIIEPLGQMQLGVSDASTIAVWDINKVSGSLLGTTLGIEGALMPLDPNNPLRAEWEQQLLLDGMGFTRKTGVCNWMLRSLGLTRKHNCSWFSRSLVFASGDDGAEDQRAQAAVGGERSIDAVITRGTRFKATQPIPITAKARQHFFGISSTCYLTPTDPAKKRCDACAALDKADDGGDTADGGDSGDGGGIDSGGSGDTSDGEEQQPGRRSSSRARAAVGGGAAVGRGQQSGGGSSGEGAAAARRAPQRGGGSEERAAGRRQQPGGGSSRGRRRRRQRRRRPGTTAAGVGRARVLSVRCLCLLLPHV